MTVPAVSLPPKDSPDLVVCQPTRVELLAQSQKNAVEWRGALSFEAYLRREEHLSNQTLTKGSGITNWVLVDKSLPPDQRVVLAGCDTYRKRALVARDGRVEVGIVHGVGSVFTPPEFRGRGYGVRMIKEMATRLRDWQSDHGICFCSVLFSDIGKTFYTKLGWAPYQSSHVLLAPSKLDSNTASSIRYLESQDLPSLCAADESLVRKRLDSLARRSDSAATMVLCPDHMTMAWHHAREEFVAAEVLGRVPHIKGAMTMVDDTHRAWCIWTRMYYNQDPTQRTENSLHILRLVVEGEEDDASAPVVAATRRLLAAAQAQADEWILESVELWNPSQSSLTAAQQIDPTTQVVHREEESIASLNWYGAGHVQHGTDVKWLNIEKYNWC